MSLKPSQRSRAQISRAAIQRLYISMRHLFIRGSYKPLGTSGEAMIEALLALRPEIYGSIADQERVELNGLLYVMQRLPQGIEQFQFVKLISREGYESSDFQPIIPAKRRRNCYQIDENQIFIEMSRGRSDVFDILTHLTFLYNEAEKIRKNSLDAKGRVRREWDLLKETVRKELNGEELNKEVAYTYLSTILGRTFLETVEVCKKFEKANKVNSIFRITYQLGRLSMQEFFEDQDREISFSSALREKIGHHIFGEVWATNIKNYIAENDWLLRPIHIVSANMHSVMNWVFAEEAIGEKVAESGFDELLQELSLGKNKHLRNSVEEFALANGMAILNDASGMNIPVQVFDFQKIKTQKLLTNKIDFDNFDQNEIPIIVVMDYAFGEQAYESMDELLKPYEKMKKKIPMRIESVNIMGKAGILEGGKGDLMIPTAHVFEGSADNYPVENQLRKEDFEGKGLRVFEGPMITVLGTSLQNRDILKYFARSSWKAIGLEMEGAHYQKAIQAAAKIRNGIRSDLSLRYAYYASDNPLETGSTLASGSLGADGVKPTYLITEEILFGVLKNEK